METHTTEAKWMVLRSAQLSASVFICVDIYLYALLVISFTDTCVLLLVLCRFGLPVSTASTGSSKIAATPATVSCTCSISVHPQFLLQLLCPPPIPVAASLSAPHLLLQILCPPQPTVAASVHPSPLLQLLCPLRPPPSSPHPFCCRFSAHPNPLLQILSTPAHCCRFCPPQPTVADSVHPSPLLQILCPPPRLCCCRFSVHPHISPVADSLSTPTSPVADYLSTPTSPVADYLSTPTSPVADSLSTPASPVADSLSTPTHCCRFSDHPNPLLKVFGFCAIVGLVSQFVCGYFDCHLVIRGWAISHAAFF